MDHSSNSNFSQIYIIYLYDMRKAKQSKFSEECDDYILAISLTGLDKRMMWS